VADEGVDAQQPWGSISDCVMRSCICIGSQHTIVCYELSGKLYETMCARTVY